MSLGWPVGELVLIVAAILWASRRPALQPIFHWLPIPLWCYLLPLLAVTFGWLPAAHPAYRLTTNAVLPFALVLLLIGVDSRAVWRSGSRALVAMAFGACGIVIGAPLGVWWLRAALPSEAWKGAGALAGTWTGGTMNLLSLRTMLEIPDAAFAPLIIVDALIAYGWMACLVGLSSVQPAINRWLKADETLGAASTLDPEMPRSTRHWKPAALVAGCAVILTQAARVAAGALPPLPLVGSQAGLALLLVTTVALALSTIPQIRALGHDGRSPGYSCLYLVLAATGAQADLHALWTTPVWLLVGGVAVIVHAAALLIAGRVFRIPLSLLATASQANIGGVASAPLVGAIYDQSLAAVGLLLAMAGNALGTYLGWLSALLCRWLLLR